MSRTVCYSIEDAIERSNYGLGGEGGLGGSGGTQGGDVATAVCPDPNPGLATAIICQTVDELLPSNAGECCYATTQCYTCGRPYVVGGRARVAGVVAREDWSKALEAMECPDPRVARAWLEDARMEHASIASFVKLALELLALGAPAELVRECQLAMGDEIEHAELCFGIASQLLGEPVGPGCLEVPQTARAPALLSVTLATVREGCVAETLAALAARERADLAQEPALRAALSRIADDEARHAAFAWKIVAWALSLGDQGLRRAVAGALAEELAAIAGERRCESGNAELLNAFGCLSAAQEAEVRRRGAREVVARCASTLLADGPAAFAEAHEVPSLGRFGRQMGSMET